MKKERKKIVLVLSGGGIAGITHLGVIQGLQEKNIPIDRIVGASAGSIVGSFFAHFKKAEKAYQRLKSYIPTRYSFRTFGLPSFFEGFAGKGIFSLEKIEKIFENLLGKQSIQDLPIPLTIAATNLESGKVVGLTKGNLARAICASIAIPGFFKAVVINKVTYIDGAVLGEIPTQLAKKKENELLIASNIAFPEGKRKTEIVPIKTWDMIQAPHRAKQLKLADFVIQPDIGYPLKIWMPPKEVEELHQKGIEAGRKSAKKIRQIM